MVWCNIFSYYPVKRVYALWLMASVSVIFQTSHDLIVCWIAAWRNSAFGFKGYWSDPNVFSKSNYGAVIPRGSSFKVLLFGNFSGCLDKPAIFFGEGRWVLLLWRLMEEKSLLRSEKIEEKRSLYSIGLNVSIVPWWSCSMVLDERSSYSWRAAYNEILLFWSGGDIWCKKLCTV